MRDLRPRFERLADEEKADVLIDLRKVEFMDSSGIGALVFLYKRLSAQGRKLSALATQGQPRRLLEFLRIDRVIEIAPDDPECPLLADPVGGMPEPRTA